MDSRLNMTTERFPDPSYNKEAIQNIIIDIKNQINSSVWKLDFTTAIELIRRCLDITLAAKENLESADLKLELCIQRLYMIEEIHETTHQLRDLLANTIEFMPLDELLEPFEKINIWEEKEDNIKNAMVNFYSKLSVLDEPLASILTKKLSNTRNSRQKMEIIYEYRVLLKLKSVYQELSRPDLKQGLTYCQDTINTIDNNLNKLLGEDTNKITQSLIKARTFRAELESIRQWTKSIFSELPNSEDIHSALLKTIQTISQTEKSLIKKWLQMCNEQMDQYLKSKSILNLRFDSNGRLVLNQNYSMIMLVQTSKQLQCLGVNVPTEFKKFYDSISQIYPNVYKLKQIVHFYNNIEKQIIKSQQPMLLDLALNFEKIVKSFGTESELSESKIHQLKTAADQLIKTNRVLRGYHETMISYVCKLGGVNLLRYPGKWKEILQLTRQKVVELQIYGSFDVSRMSSWINHWDYQLYKLLQVSYIMGLKELCNLTVVDIQQDDTYTLVYQVEMCVRNNRIDVKPPIEELRAEIYKDLKKFLAIPNNFRGVFLQGPTLISFSKLVESNEKSIVSLYQETEKLFRKLLKFVEGFRVWESFISLAILEEFPSFNTEQEWEYNFRLVKSKSKELELMPSYSYVNCIKISTAGLKNAVEAAFQKCYDRLASSLNNSILSHINNVDLFITENKKNLQLKPETIAQFGLLATLYSTATESLAEYEEKRVKITQLHTLMKQVSSYHYKSIDLTTINSKWDEFVQFLNDYDKKMADQIADTKAKVQQHVQKFKLNSELFLEKWDQLGPRNINLDDADSLAKGLAFIRSAELEMDKLMNECTEIKHECEYFNIESDKNFNEDQLQKVSEELSLWATYSQFNSDFLAFMESEWIIVRNKIDMVVDLMHKWKQLINTDTLVDRFVKAQLSKLEKVVMFFKQLRGDNWTLEHWKQFADKWCKLTIKEVTDLKFIHVYENISNIERDIDSIRSFNTRAAEQMRINEALTELKRWADMTSYQISEINDSSLKSVIIIKNWASLFESTGDKLSLVESLKVANGSDKFMETINQWDVNVTNLLFCMRNVNEIQRKYLYLYPVLYNYQKASLSREVSDFRSINTQFTDMMKFIQQNPLVLNLLKYPNVMDHTKSLLHAIESTLKRLMAYLDEKRFGFARFFFVGDDDLLEILGQGSKVNIIEAHIKKMFGSISALEHNNLEITGIKSAEGECVSLNSPVKVVNDAEVWLSGLEKEVKKTLRLLLGTYMSKPGTFTDFEYPEQIILLGEAIRFTTVVEKMLDSGKVSWNEIINIYASNLKSIQTFVCETKSNESKRKNLILQFIYFLEVMNDCNEHKCSSKYDWHWIKYLRFYVQDSMNVLISCIDSSIEYSFEYQGNVMRLVHTRLTQKCFMTLMQSIKHGQGGNPFGPAGTGKTETVKMLGNLCGRQVLVFNCDEAIDFQSMSKMLLGIVKSGAFACFDEFNRLESACLSSISVQIHSIMEAVKMKSKYVILNGLKVEVDPNASIFVTLNPASKNYGGRQQLPDNLKQLFRPFAMTEPDATTIVDYLLMAEGFHNTKDLALRFVSLFTASSKFLSRQKHYDWGIRSIKPIIGLAGKLLLRNKDECKDQMALLIEAIVSTTIPKLSHTDQKQLQSLLVDIFNTKDIVVTSNDLQITQQYLPWQIEKINQLYRAVFQRIGVGIIGPAGSGKTTCWQAMLSGMGTDVKHVHINPKSISRKTLLGHIDTDTREWTDGILTLSIREAVAVQSNVHFFIVIDGVIEPEWIEALNSVLDDNHLLTIPNGERIYIPDNVHFIFESTSLKYASPATVSRLSLIFMNDCSELQHHLHSKLSPEMAMNVTPNDIQTSVFRQIMDFEPCLSAYLSLMSFPLTTEHISSSITAYKIDDDDNDDVMLLKDYYSPFVHNLSVLTSHKRHLLVIGPNQCGKCLLVRAALSTQKATILELNCNKFTTADDLIEMIMKHGIVNTSVTGKVFKCNSKLTIVLRRVDFLQTDKYSVCSVIELVFQIISSGGFYDNDRQWMSMSDVLFILTANDKQIPALERIKQSLICVQWLTHGFRDICFEYLKSKLNELSPKLINALGDMFVEANNYCGLSLGTVKKFVRFVRCVDMDVNYIPSLALEHIEKYSNNTENLITRIKDSLNRQGIPVFGLHFTPSVGFHECSEKEKELFFANALEKASRSLPDNYICSFSEGATVFNSFNSFVSSDLGEPLLLIGTAGVGRRLLTEIYAYSHDVRMMYPLIPFNYTQKYVQSYIKLLFEMASRGERAVVLLQREHFENQHYYSWIISLCSKQLPLCLSSEDLQSVVALYKDELGPSLSKRSLLRRILDKFYTRIKVIISIDQDKYSDLITENSRVFQCTRFHMMNFQRQSLRELCKFWLRAVKVDAELLEYIVSKSLDICSNYKYTNKDVYNYFKVYTLAFEKRFADIEKEIVFYREGLETLSHVASEARKLNETISVQSLALVDKQKEADSALFRISNKMAEATEQRSDIEKISANLVIKEREINERRLEIKEQLKNVEPLIQQARNSVGQIKAEHLSEIRSMRAPPSAVRDVLEAVLKLMGIFDMSWNNMKVFLGKRTVKEELLSFDARRLKPDIRESVKAFIREHLDSFDEATIKRSSAAAAPLAFWVKANISYSEVLDTVLPLEKELSTQEQMLQDSQAAIERIENDLKQLNHTIESMRKEFAEKTRETEILRLQVNDSKQTLDYANNLLTNLSDENIRWQDLVNKLKTQSNDNIKTCILIATLTTFLHSLDVSSREIEIKRCCEEVELNHLKFQFALSSFIDPSHMKLLELADLGNNQHFMGNMVIFSLCARFPVFVDPEDKVSGVLRNLDYDVVSVSDPNFLRSLELSIRFGKKLLISGYDETNPSLMNVFRYTLINDDNRYCVSVGDRLVELNHQTRLAFVGSNLSTDDITNKYVYSISSAEGFTSELLSQLLFLYAPDLDETRRRANEEKSMIDSRLNEIEKQMITALQSSSDNLLSNKSVVDMLLSTKSKSLETKKLKQQIEAIEEDISRMRNSFIDVANFTHTIYKAVLSLNVLNPLYVFGQRQFCSWILDGLKKVSKDASFESMKRQIISSVFKHITVALMEEDLLSFYLYFMKSIDDENIIKTSQWNFLLGRMNENGTTDISWAPKHFQTLIRNIMNVMHHVPRDVISNKQFWLEWIQNDRVNNDYINKFDHLFMSLYVKPQNFDQTLQEYFMTQYGTEISNQCLSNIMAANDPILFIITPGADPTADIRSLAKEKNFEFAEVAVGTEPVESLNGILEAAKTKPLWLVIQNIHVKQGIHSFLLNRLKEKYHYNTRIALTTEAAVFPKDFLQICYKVTREFKGELRSNILMNLYDDQMSYETLLASSLHAILLERRKFIPQGWTRFYEFSETDFKYTHMALLMKNSKASIDMIKGIILDCIYGGKIDRKLDLDILHAYINRMIDLTAFEQKSIPGLIESTLNLNKTAIATHLAGIKVNESIGLTRNCFQTTQKVKIERLAKNLNSLNMVHGNFEESLSLAKSVLSLVEKTIIIPEKWPSFSQRVYIGEYLRQELILLHSVLGLIQNDLKNILSSNARTNAVAMFQISIPKSWEIESFSNNYDDLPSYVRKLCYSYKYLTTHLNHEVIDISQLLFPEALLIDFRRQIAKETGTDYNELTLTTELTYHDKCISVGGLSSHGFVLLENGSVSLDLSENSPLFSNVPTLMLCWTKSAGKLSYEVPVYRNLKKESEVMKVPLSTTLKNELILANACFVLDK